jgi:6-phosphogluconate dehydrogenase
MGSGSSTSSMPTMKMGMIGLGRMGANMVRRLMAAGHTCIVYNRNPAPRKTLAQEGAIPADSLAELVEKLESPRAIWMMIPAAVVDDTLSNLVPLLDEGDVVVDGGNSYFVDDLRRAGELAKRGIRYLDVGTSGGVWGLERGYCQMIGGDEEAFRRLEPLFAALAPGIGAAPRTPGREKSDGTAEQGYLRCGPSGAGHFVKMVHNGIEYGLMAAYAEGFNVLRHANRGSQGQEDDAETAPLHHPERYRYELDLREVAEVWRRGSVIGSWLLDLTAQAFFENPDLSSFAGRVSDSGEGRWTVQAGVDLGVPTPVISSALYGRFASRGEADFANQALSAMRFEFGGHREKGAAGDPGKPGARQGAAKKGGT